MYKGLINLQVQALYPEYVDSFPCTDTRISSLCKQNDRLYVVSKRHIYYVRYVLDRLAQFYVNR